MGALVNTRSEVHVDMIVESRVVQACLGLIHSRTNLGFGGLTLEKALNVVANLSFRCAQQRAVLQQHSRDRQNNGVGDGSGKGDGGGCDGGPGTCGSKACARLVELGVVETLRSLALGSPDDLGTYVRLRATMTMSCLVGEDEEFDEIVIEQCVEALSNGLTGNSYLDYIWDAAAPLTSLWCMSRSDKNRLRMATPSTIKLMHRVQIYFDNDSDSAIIATKLLADLEAMRHNCWSQQNKLGPLPAQSEFVVLDVSVEAVVYADDHDSTSSLGPAHAGGNKVVDDPSAEQSTNVGQPGLNASVAGGTGRGPHRLRPGTPYFMIRVKCRNKHEFWIRKTHLDFDQLRARTVRGRGRMPEYSPAFSWGNLWDPVAREDAHRRTFEVSLGPTPPAALIP